MHCKVSCIAPSNIALKSATPGTHFVHNYHRYITHGVYLDLKPSFFDASDVLRCRPISVHPNRKTVLPHLTVHNTFLTQLYNFAHTVLYLLQYASNTFVGYNSQTSDQHMNTDALWCFVYPGTSCIYASNTFIR